MAQIGEEFVPVPVNIDTVNILLNQSISDKDQMKEWLNRNQVHYDIPKNGEEAALSRVGKELYEQIFKPYTYKQWSKYPEELNASVLLRIPVSDSFDDRYFPNDPYQALPTNGYTTIIQNMLAHENIRVLLGLDYLDMRSSFTFVPERTIYTGPIDHYFSNSGLPKLEYRSIHFESTTLYNISFFQPNSVVNHPQGPEKFTRIVEYKHFLAHRSPHTTIVKEFSRDTGDPYYPVPNQKNQELYIKYKQLATTKETTENVYFVGRLANYKYFNMDEAILNVFAVFESIYNVIIPPFEVVEKQRHKFQQKSLTIVVNRCEENLKSLHRMKSLYSKYVTTVVIYDKCSKRTNVTQIRNKLKDSKVLNYRLLNVGREGHSWMDFILSKQSLFSDVNLFIQAQPHSIYKLQRSLHKLKQKTDYLTFKNGGCHRLEESVDLLRFPYNLDKKTGCEYVKRFINSESCKVQISYKGEFVVTESRLRRTLTKYRRQFVELYSELSQENNPRVGHLLERLWTTIFTQVGC